MYETCGEIRVETDPVCVVSGLAWSLVKEFTFLHALGVCLIMVLRDYLLVSLLTASILWSAFLGLTQPKHL